MKFWKLASITTVLVLSTSVNAATIVDTASLTAMPFYTLGNFTEDQDPLGQSFVLDQSYENLMVGGVLQDVNAFLNPTFDINISLVRGAGTSGTLLGSKTVTLEDGFSGLYMEDFSFIGSLSAGTYSLLFSSGATGRGSLRFVENNPYELGSAYNELGVFDPLNILGQNMDIDAAIRITGDVSAVPIPAAVWLFGSGLFGLIGFTRRKKV